MNKDDHANEVEKIMLDFFAFRRTRRQALKMLISGLKGSPEREPYIRELESLNSPNAEKFARKTAGVVATKRLMKT